MESMAVSFSATTREQEPEIWQFLRDIFRLTERPATLTPTATDWKYFDAHPWWPEGRSYTLRTPTGIAAHGFVSPVRFDRGGATVESAQIVDWAAGGAVPAGGLLLCRKSLETGGTLLAIGGTAEALAVFRKVKWFARKDDVRYYARPLRPWRHLARSPKAPRDLARFVRNLFWQCSPRWPRSGQWTVRSARPGEDVFSHLGDFVPMVRTRGWFDYLLRCPIVRTELVILESAGVPQGHAFLAHFQGCVRLADFVVAGAVSQSDRVAAFSALGKFLAAQPGVAEMVAASSLAEMGAVFEACGLRPRGVQSVYLADPAKRLPPDARLEITPLIGDGFYLFDERYPFTC
jgi:hypothetical protein